MPLLDLVLTLSLIAPLGAAPAEEPGSPRLRCTALATTAPCRETPNGLVVGPTAEAVTQAADEATVAETTWAEAFGARPPAYAVVLDGAHPVEDVRAVGASRVLPWISASARRGAMEQAVRDAVAKQATAGQAEALMTAAVQRAAPQIAASVAKASQPGVMAHELGHLWYIETYWAGVAQGGDAYGSAAPDWLDEAAAVLMEGEGLTQARRAAFQKVWNENPRADAVSSLLAETHPAFASGASAAALTDGAATWAATGAGPRVMTMSGEEFQRRTGTDINAASAFYTRVRAFLDFMEAKTGDHAALIRLTIHLRQGGDVEPWFAQDPAGRQMGGSVSAADQAFKVWADERTGQTA